MLFLAGFLEHVQKGFLSTFLYVLSSMYHQEVRQREKTLISNVIPEQVQEASLLQIACQMILYFPFSSQTDSPGSLILREHRDKHQFNLRCFLGDDDWAFSLNLLVKQFQEFVIEGVVFEGESAKRSLPVGKYRQQFCTCRSTSSS